MGLAVYSRDVLETTKARVRARYTDEIRQLTALGFEELTFYSELLRPFSLIRDLPMLLLMRSRGEVLSRHPRLSVGASYLLFSHDTPPTIALPFGMGLKLYSCFTNELLFITANFPGATVSAEAHGVRKDNEVMSFADAWRHHRREADALVARGLEVRRAASYEAFVEMSEREEAAVMPGAPGAAGRAS